MQGTETCYKETAVLNCAHKVNLIYGLNGVGKSTLSNYLAEYPNVEDKYKNCSIDKLNSDEQLLVYNQSFVQKNFYESENQKGIFSLTKENKDALTAIEKANNELKILLKDKDSYDEKLKKCIEKKKKNKKSAENKVWKIKQLYTGGDRILENCFDGLGVKGSAEKLFEFLSNFPLPTTKVRELKEIKNDIQLYSDNTLSKIDTIEIPNYLGFEIEMNNLFSKIIVGNKNSTISSVIEKLHNSDWVKDGITYLPENINKTIQCPFCQSNTITPELLKNLKDYFDASYKADMDELNKLHTRYLMEFEKLSSIDILENCYPSEPYKKDLELALLSLKNEIRKNSEIIQKKISTSSTPVSLTSTKELFNSVKILLEKINIAISTQNEKIIQRDRILKECKKEFWDKMRLDYDACICSYNSVNSQLLEEEAEIKEKLVELEINSNTQKQIIKENQLLTVNIDEAVENIKAGLLDLGISDFSIKSQGDNVYTITRGDDEKPVFNSLSEGEKMVISFLYFIELCKGKESVDETAKKKIIIIDDPISSLSHIYIFNIGRLIQNEFIRPKKYEQIFILSHSLYFIYELADNSKDRRDKFDEKMYRIMKSQEGSRFIDMNYEEIQNDYHSYWLVVRDVYQTPALVANCMRNIIDYFFNFVEKTDLNNVFQKKELQNTKYQAFMRYINRESHSLGQNIFDIKEFDYDSFAEAFRLVFKLSGYEEHYNKMMKL